MSERSLHGRREDGGMPPVEVSITCDMYPGDIVTTISVSDTQNVSSRPTVTVVSISVSSEEAVATDCQTTGPCAARPDSEVVDHHSDTPVTARPDGIPVGLDNSCNIRQGGHEICDHVRTEATRLENSLDEIASVRQPDGEKNVNYAVTTGDDLLDDSPLGKGPLSADASSVDGHTDNCSHTKVAPWEANTEVRYEDFPSSDTVSGGGEKCLEDDSLTPNPQSTSPTLSLNDKDRQLQSIIPDGNTTQQSAVGATDKPPTDSLDVGSDPPAPMLSPVGTPFDMGQKRSPIPPDEELKNDRGSPGTTSQESGEEEWGSSSSTEQIEYSPGEFGTPSSVLNLIVAPFGNYSPPDPDLQDEAEPLPLLPNARSRATSYFKHRSPRRPVYPKKQKMPSAGRHGLHLMRFSAGRIAAALEKRAKKKMLREAVHLSEHHRLGQMRRRVNEANRRWDKYDASVAKEENTERVKFADTATLRIVLEERVTLINRMVECFLASPCTGKTRGDNSETIPIMKEFEFSTT